MQFIWCGCGWTTWTLLHFNSSSPIVAKSKWSFFFCEQHHLQFTSIIQRSWSMIHDINSLIMQIQQLWQFYFLDISMPSLFPKIQSTITNYSTQPPAIFISQRRWWESTQTHPHTHTLRPHNLQQANQPVYSHLSLEMINGISHSKSLI